MAEELSPFQLPGKIEAHLGTLAKLYTKEGKERERDIVLNATVRIEEGVSTDRDWGVESSGHALYLSVPEDVYIPIVRKKNEIERELAHDLNHVKTIKHEWIESVSLEMSASSQHDRHRIAVHPTGTSQMTSDEVIMRVWGGGGYRVFISHKAEVKQAVSTVKAGLRAFGVAGFVAHEDIHPTREWQDEIERALESMDAFVALLTSDYRDSPWTDQEVGFALGRRVPIIAVKLGKDPYGFIGKFQALSCSWDSAPKEISRLLINQPRMLEAYIEAAAKCSSWENGNYVSQVLPDISQIADIQVQKLVSAFNEKGYLNTSHGFRGDWKTKHGEGLAFHLSRLTGRDYQVTSLNTIEVMPWS